MLDELAGLLEPDDIVIDGGNSYYRDDIDRAKQLQPRQLHYMDVGTSGGIYGLERGYCLMIGGEDGAGPAAGPDLREHRARLGQRRADARPDPGDGTAADGYLHCGPNGAGHFVKMVHNGIEYGMMAAIAEGLSIIKHANVGKAEVRVGRRGDHPAARPAVLPVRHRRGRGRRGVAARLGGQLLAGGPDRRRAGPLAAAGGFAGHVSDSGEGRWTVVAAIDEGVPAPVITAALFERFESRGLGEFSHKLLSALRSEFGGHAEKERSPAS